MCKETPEKRKTEDTLPCAGGTGNPGPIDYRACRRLLAWYGRVRAPWPWRLHPAPYQVWISEVMLQQTVITTVLPYYERWMQAFPDLESLAGAGEREVLLLWEGLGYYSRARHILETARLLVARHHAAIPASYEALVQLPGIGDYTACAILSIAFGQPYPVLDANVRRIFQRLLNREEMGRAEEHELKALLKELITVTVEKAHRPQPGCRAGARPREQSHKNTAGAFNEAFMQLGQTRCKTKQPLCSECCLAYCCRAFALGRQHRIPAVKRRELIVKQTTLFIFLKDDLVWLARKAGGPLKDLWSFPSSSRAGQADFLKEFTGTGSCQPVFIKSLKLYTHHYTVYKDELLPLVYRFMAAVPPSLPASGKWVPVAGLAGYPFPSVYRKIIDELCKLSGDTLASPWTSDPRG